MKRESIYMDLESAKGRKRITDINMVAKTIFKKYAVVNNICIALDEKYYEHKVLHKDAIVIIKDNVPNYPFLDMVEFDANEFNKALRNRCKNYSFENEKLVLSKGKMPDIYKVGDKISEDVVENTFMKLSAFKTYERFATTFDSFTNEWIMDSESKEVLLKHGAPKFIIGKTKEGDGIKLKCHHRVFPAIKKAESIRIYSKLLNPDNNDLYEIFIVSEADDWRMITRHVIVNF